MKVTLLEYTGKGDPWQAARLLVYTKSTRLTQGEASWSSIQQMSTNQLMIELEYMANTVRSSWEFVDYTFQIEGVSRGFTHQFVRTRTGSYAQQSQRSVDMSEFDYITPDGLEGSQERLALYQDTMSIINGAYQSLLEDGCPIQDARGLLPTNISTNIIAKFNLRTMADLAGKRDNPRAQGEYTSIFKAMAQVVLEVHPWASVFLYPARLDTPALDKILLELLAGRNPSQCPNINDALKELDRLKGVWG